MKTQQNKCLFMWEQMHKIMKHATYCQYKITTTWCKQNIQET